MRILSDLLNESIVNAFGWTIFHILWQGTLIALFTGLLLRILNRKSSQLRYLITLCSLLLVVGLSVFNFVNNYEKKGFALNQDLVFSNETVSSHELPLRVFSNLDTKISETGILKSIFNGINNLSGYFPLIVSLWFIGVGLFLIRFIFSYLFTSRLRTVGIIDIQDEWLQKFNEIGNKLHVKRTVRFIESTLIKVPIVLGYLKPIVIIPAEMLLGIPRNQIEAIVAHELAHIRRNDYIINVIQTIIETVFFFHPAVWYLSSKISNERENCCDDIALTVCDGSLVYAKALVSIQDLSLRKHYAAVAFSGRKKHLLNRIKRMIMKPKGKSNFTDKIIAATIILSAIVALSFTYGAEYPSEKGLFNEITKEKPAKEPAAPTVPAVPEKIEKAELSILAEPALLEDVEEIASPELILERDTIKKHSREYLDIDGNTIIKTRKNKKGKQEELKFTLKNGKVTSLYVDGNEIPEKDYDKYQSEIDKTIDDLEDAKIDIREAIQDIESLDLDELHLEIEEAMKNVHIDMVAVQEDIKRAMEDVKMIDIEEIMKNVELELKELGELQELHDFDIDFDFDDESFHFDMDEINLEEIREQIEKAHEEMKEHVDMEEIQRELLKVQEELSKISEEDIKIQMEESAKHFEEFNKEETIKELEEKLEEIENLELEEK
jgi:bla regulator protein blaR1